MEIIHALAAALGVINTALAIRAENIHSALGWAVVVLMAVLIYI